MLEFVYLRAQIWLWWVGAVAARAVRAVVSPFLAFVRVFMVAPVRIAVWNWVQLITLPLNVCLRLTVGATWAELLRTADTWFSKYVVVTICQYAASVVLLGVSLGVAGGTCLALFHYYAKVPSYYVEIPLRFWRLPGFLFDKFVRPRLPQALQQLDVAALQTAVRSLLHAVGLDLAFLDVQDTSDLPTPPSSPQKFSPYDKALFLRDFYPLNRRGTGIAAGIAAGAAGPAPADEAAARAKPNPQTLVEPVDTNTTETSNDSTNVWDEFDTIPSLFEDETERLTTVTRRTKLHPVDVIQISKINE